MMNRIAELRKFRGLSQTDLAKQLGIAQNTLSQYENGYRNPTSRVIMNIARILDVSTNDILDYPKPKVVENAPTDYSLINVTKVEQTSSTDEANVLLSLGWKMLHIGSYSSCYDDGSCTAYTLFTLGWYGDPQYARVYVPEPAGEEYTEQI